MASSNRKHELLSGAFILLAVTAFGLLAFSGGDFSALGFRRERLPCVAYFDTVKGLTIGAPVKVGGNAVGEVVSIDLARREVVTESAEGPGKERVFVRVRFELEPSDSLHMDFGESAGSSVRVHRDGFLGTDYLLLVPASWSRDRAPPRTVRNWMELQRTEPRDNLVSVALGGDLDALIGRAGPLVESLDSLLSDLRGVVAKVDRALDDEGVLVGTVKNANELLVSGRALVERFLELVDSDYRDGLHALLLRPASRLLESSDETVRSVGQNANATLDSVKSILEDGRSTMATARSAVGRVDAALAAADPRVQQILSDLGSMMGGLDRRLDDLQNQVTALTSEGSGLLKDGRGMVASSQPELVESLRRLRRTMWQAEMAVRKVRANPAVILFGDNEPLLEAEAADETRLRQAGKAAPFGQREER